MRLTKTSEEIQILKKGGAILAEILRTLSKEAKPGVSTLTLEEKALKLMKEAGATPAFLNYTPQGAKRAFPAALCVSINEEVVHGIPNEKPKILKDGDIVTIDTGISYGGLFTDSAVTIPVGKVDTKGLILIKATREALDGAIKLCVPGKNTGDVGVYIEKIARKYGFSPAKGLGGHGVGFSQHEDPFIPNETLKGPFTDFVPGMVVAIEPMIVEGKGNTKILSDGYTFVTRDRGRSAHVEHTVAVTDSAPIVLTK